jgi:K+-transporting ATPase ATPase C chain
MKHTTNYIRISLRYMRTATALVTLFTVVLGGVYPLLVYGIAQAAFNDKANGSLIRKEETVVGSRLLGQQFDEPRYFWGRLSATTPYYNASASSGSNLSPAHPKLLELANERIKALQKANPKNDALIPVDLITASASGLDPHISLEAALYQVERVAKARKKKPEELKALIGDMAEGGILSAPYVNVLLLNLALDEQGQ